MNPSQKKFISLPVFGACCKIFETTSGMFIECVCVNIAKTRVGCALTLGCWNENKNNPNNLYKIAILSKMDKIIEEILQGEISFQRWIRIVTNKQKMKHTPIICFLISTSSLLFTTSSTSASFSSETPSEIESSSESSATESTYVSHRNITCQGVLQIYRKYTMQQHLRSFLVNSSIQYDSKYKTGLFGVDVNFFPNVVMSQMDPNAMVEFFSTNLAMSCARGEFLRLHKLLVNTLWDSFVLRTSCINVSLLRQIAKTLSTLIILRIPT